ncbi:MAG: DUF4197 domain-containing protein [Alphaproteobacteria bacterium]
MTPLKFFAPSRAAATAIVLASVAVIFPAAAQDRNLLDEAFDVLKSIEESAPTSSAAGLSNSDITDGLLEALRVGTSRVVEAVGQADGFNADPEIHIPLPDYLSDVQGALDLVGAGAAGKDLELRLNRAAEAAAPEAREVFVDSISQMTLDDARAIYDGPDDAATRYFQRTMTPGLIERFRPIITAAMAEVGAVRAYDTMMSSYDSIPLMPDVKGELSDYAVGKTLDGLFYKLALGEAAIRHDPAARTTALLQKVFH